MLSRCIRAVLARGSVSKSTGFYPVGTFAMALVSNFALAAADPSSELEETVVWGQNHERKKAGYVSPTSLLKQQDLASINVATTEDVVKYEPSLVIRRRFIGDSNGVMGMRGSNMFQTSRSMVFADGVPLHYLLQSRWNGAPRWTMVSASEIAQVETLYGPFSAEYSGNSLGGVVLIETAIPQQREVHFDTAFFSQSFDDYGFDDEVNGYKTFMSYGDRLGDMSVYFSYNRLENDAQPQSFYSGDSSSDATPTTVSGAIAGVDSQDRPSLYFGDTGVVDTTTDNFKVKLGYEFGQWSALLNIAYEDRSSISDEANSYVRDSAGNPVWSGDVTQAGEAFSIPASRLGSSELERQSLSVGLRFRGELSERVGLEGNVNVFDVLSDEDRSSALNPDDPAYTPAGEVATFNDTGWQTAEVKLNIDNVLTDGLNLITGARFEAYELNYNLYDSSAWSSGSKDALSGSSGGKTDIVAAFLQANWRINEWWDVSAGGRYEAFESSDGYFSNDDPTTSELDITSTGDVSQEQFSPKFSVGLRPAERWQLRYSYGKAYRFPVVEELFSQYEAFNAVSIANPELEPEDADAHNLMIDRDIADGYLRVNLFSETVGDVIESQFTTLQGGLSVTTFVPIDEVQTQGIEFIANQHNMLLDNLDVRFNVTYTDSEIVRNQPDPSIEGNRYPRMPKWRSNLLATYHVNEQWDIGANLQYASDSFGRNDNTDTANQVYGAQDGYTRIGLKTTWRVTRSISMGVGVDNLTDEMAYVAHPWPGRTLYGNFAYDLR